MPAPVSYRSLEGARASRTAPSPCARKPSCTRFLRFAWLCSPDTATTGWSSQLVASRLECVSLPSLPLRGWVSALGFRHVLAHVRSTQGMCTRVTAVLPALPRDSAHCCPPSSSARASAAPTEAKQVSCLLPGAAASMTHVLPLGHFAAGCLPFASDL